MLYLRLILVFFLIGIQYLFCQVKEIDSGKSSLKMMQNKEGNTTYYISNCYFEIREDFETDQILLLEQTKTSTFEDYSQNSEITIKAKVLNNGFDINPIWTISQNGYKINHDLSDKIVITEKGEYPIHTYYKLSTGQKIVTASTELKTFHYPVIKQGGFICYLSSSSSSYDVEENLIGIIMYGRNDTVVHKYHLYFDSAELLPIPKIDLLDMEGNIIDYPMNLFSQSTKAYFYNIKLRLYYTKNLEIIIKLENDELNCSDISTTAGFAKLVKEE